MQLLSLLQGGIPAEALNELGQQTGNIAGDAGSAAMQFAGNPMVLAGGIGLVIAAALVFFFIKKVIINSVLGAIVWAIIYFGLGIKLPAIASLAVSIIFGPAALGVMLVLRFFGII